MTAHPQRVLIEVGRLPLHHLYGHDAQGPDVHLGPVGLAGHHLRGHPVGRAHHGTALALLRVIWAQKPKSAGMEREKQRGERERDRENGIFFISGSPSAQGRIYCIITN